MLSRQPPSERDPALALQRAVRQLSRNTPGVGRLVNASPPSARPVTTTVSGGAASSTASLHVGPDAPTNGAVLWYDTDATC